MDRRRFVAMIGGALAAPLARAQRPAKAVRIGLLAQISNLDTDYWRPFYAELARRGWRQGIEYSIETKEARGDPARALQLARELVANDVDLILALSTAAAVAARQASATVPIVTWCGYPVEAGLAMSLARPGSNVTGVANYANADVWGKFVELLRDIKPTMRELGVLWDYAPPAFPDGLVPLPAIDRAAQKFGLRSRTWMIRSETDLARALSEVEGGKTDGLIISYSGGVHFRPDLIEGIGAFIRRRRLAAITDIAPLKTSPMGFVIAYSPNGTEIITRLAHQIDRVLRGAKPADLPFELPQRYDIAIYAQAAKAIGITIPQSVLLRADRVIE